MPTRGKSTLSRTKRGKDSTMLSRTQSFVQIRLPLPTVESPVITKNQTSTDKSNICKNNSQKQKLLATLEADSITKEKVCFPYWNEQCKEISSKLWCPTKIDFADLDTNLSISSSEILGAKSWFSTKKIKAINKSLPKICLPSSTSSVVECMEEGVTPKSKRIRIYPNQNQKKLLKHWFGVSRYVFNQTVAYLKQPETKANWKAIKTSIIQSLPDWAKEVPYQIKSISIRDACIAIQNAKKKYKLTGQIQEVKFRSKRDLSQSVFIPKSAINNHGVYYTVIGDMKLVENLPDVIKDSRLICHHGQYYLNVSTETPTTQSENQGRVVALDPGVRTFLTYFTPEEVGKLGDKDFGRIQRLCFFLDDLISRHSLATSEAKRRMKKAEKRLRLKIKNLIKEAHHQIANWLTTNFDVILLPTFETSQMSTKAKRKLNKKSVRAMLTWSHYSFQQFLLHKAKERNKTVLLVNEAYTSKTVSWTGEIDFKLGGKKRIVSKYTNTWMDRDINGARGIFLRALVDTPFLEYLKNAFINAC